MPDNQLFNSRTNFLKNEKNINFAEQAARLRVERHVFDSWRANRVTVPEHIEERLVSEFTELANYRTDIPDVVNDSEEQGQYVKMEPGMVSEMITMQRDMIKMLREEIARKTVEAERLRGEVKALREMRGKG